MTEHLERLTGGAVYSPRAVLALEELERRWPGATVPQARPAIAAAVRAATGDWRPGRWWRVTYSDGRCYESGINEGHEQIWCETSVEAEAREALATCPGGGVLWRFYECTAPTEWREVEP